MGRWAWPAGSAGEREGRDQGREGQDQKFRLQQLDLERWGVVWRGRNQNLGARPQAGGWSHGSGSERRAGSGRGRDYLWEWSLSYFAGQSLQVAGLWLARPGTENNQDKTGGSQRLLYIPNRRSPPPPLRPVPRFAPLVKTEPRRPVEEEPKIAGDLDQEPSLLYADLDCMALRRHRQLSPVVPADASTIYAVVV